MQSNYCNFYRTTRLAINIATIWPRLSPDDEPFCWFGDSINCNNWISSWIVCIRLTIWIIKISTLSVVVVWSPLLNCFPRYRLSGTTCAIVTKLSWRWVALLKTWFTPNLNQKWLSNVNARCNVLALAKLEWAQAKHDKMTFEAERYWPQSIRLMPESRAFNV